MRPAELVLYGRPPVVCAVPIADEYAVGSAEDRACRHGVAPRVDHEDRDRRGHHGPEPSPAACFTPARLVGVLDRRLDDESLGLLDGRSEGAAGDLLTADDGPYGDAEPEHVAHQIRHGALAQAIDPHQGGHHRHDARSERTCRHADGQRSRRANAAHAVERVQHVLLDDGLDARKLEYLMTTRRRVVANERRAAPATALRLQHHELVYVAGGHERTVMLVVSLLPAGTAPARPLLARRRRARPIARRRLRGIARRPMRLLLELRHACE